MVTSTVQQVRVLRRSEKPPVYAALAGDVLVAAVKFAAAYATLSSAMLSEGVHSVVDAGTEILLLYGLIASTRKPNEFHQFGFGREVFFWNFVVAVLMLAVGAGVALWEGLSQVMNPTQIENAYINYAVLAVAFVIELVAWSYAAKRADSARGNLSFFRYLRRKRDATTFTILFGGLVSLLGLIFTAVGNALSVWLENPVYDGAASIAIAAILALAAVVLAGTSKTLLIGVPADPSVVESIISVTLQEETVIAVNGAITTHLAPDQLLVALSVVLERDMTTDRIEDAIAEIEKRLHRAHTEIVALSIKPEKAERFEHLHRVRYGLVEEVVSVPKKGDHDA